MRVVRYGSLAAVVAMLFAVALRAGEAAWRGILVLLPSRAPAAAPPDADLAAGCVMLALLGIAVVCSWLAVAVVASAVDLTRPARSAGAEGAWTPSRTVAPWLVRRLVAAVLGVATLAAVTPAYAETTAPNAPAAAAVTVTGVDRPEPALTFATAPVDRPALGWTAPSPQRRQSTHAASAAQLVTGQPRGTLSVVADVTVRRGDSLWSIAARHLAATGRPHAVADVAREWPRWWAANAHTIGADPDSLLPGQRLVPPALR